jgi:outer membrane protein OmpA-like peptidoglycan-associated protein
MRVSFLMTAGLALSLAVPAFADPAYTTDKVVNFLLQSKSHKLGATRGLHLQDPATDADTQAKKFDLLVNFEFDYDHLTAAAKANLDQFASALRDPRVKEGMKGEKLAIDGFTDATGAEVYNLHLSERRAEAVAKYLSQKGADPKDLVAKGFGPDKPRTPDPFDPVNRRVEAHLAE